MNTIKQTLLIAIAMTAHTINQAYCQSIGDESVPSWGDAPEDQKNSIIAGVEMHLANPETTPEQSHQAWLDRKLAEGWVYGEVKNTEEKQHPCILPYEQLPAEQKSKDYLFRATVHSVLYALNNAVTEAVVIAVEELKANIATAPSPTAVPAAPMVISANMIAVEYIGRRDYWKDLQYNSGLDFVTGQTRVLPTNIAKQLLRHPDLFKEAASAPDEEVAQQLDDTQSQLDAGKRELDKKDDRRDELNVIDLVNTMDKEAVANYAMSNYGLKINRSKSVENMRTELSAHISQVGTK